MDQHRAPLYDALAAHARRNVHAFHVPGHKQRAFTNEENVQAQFECILPIDLTELADTDDLHHPEGPIIEAQQLAAQCYGVEETSFLVGGSTVGNLAMILGTCESGDLLIVQRNVHKSIIHGLMLAGVQAVMLQPYIDPYSGLATVPSVNAIAEAIKHFPNAKGIVLSTPNYYGMSSNLNAIVVLAHAHQIAVLVDEAHGPHFGFHPALPHSAIQAGADVVVHSTHKMLSAMTMGAMLHMQGELVDKSSIKQALRMVQSSSPSFPIMASIDLARRQLQVEGTQALSNALEAVQMAVQALEKTSFGAVGYGVNQDRSIQYDPLKLCLYDRSAKLSGAALRDELERRGCIAEMADDRYVVMAFGIGSTMEDGRVLYGALLDIAKHLGEANDSKAHMPSIIDSIATPTPIQFSRKITKHVELPLELTVGNTSAEWVIPYPPGIPVLYPGELISADTIVELQRWRGSRVQIQGVADRTLQTIKVQQSKD
ncbi:MAG: aminotransferase class I/II-fold pyridoxal phosphate-dependent enzyme [Candidatus Cohnella colombiensis]|uniref:Aminotransferase class I/II-fold pyridoxal phosphate-dependent enzyme n=1 Tax=Candidatus Cohnella colombiensis TaxID=3121368 RepID=A0AA95EVJ6_9BACL|nr:MAG: aminotransferase class I/II-fold pyridoxal phosphate-dependent enzyme [Cohnella sp.]